MHNEYRKLWADAGYSDGCGSAAVVRPPSKTYLRAYYFTSAQHAISSIGLSRIKVARVSDVNDPFELMALNFRQRNIRKVVREFKRDFDGHKGLLCFSADWLSPVLWSHYADRHRGICLGFNLLRNGLDLRQVTYSNERLNVELAGPGTSPTINRKIEHVLLCTKYSHWSYENEWRIFVRLRDAHNEGRHYFLPFSRSIALAEVILGARCEFSITTIRHLTTALHPEAVTFGSRPAMKWFSIVPDEKSVP